MGGVGQCVVVRKSTMLYPLVGWAGLAVRLPAHVCELMGSPCDVRW
jgi:hypothetical protein